MAKTTICATEGFPLESILGFATFRSTVGEGMEADVEMNYYCVKSSVTIYFEAWPSKISEKKKKA